MSLSKKTLSGLSWTMLGTVGNVLLQLFYTSWISQILSPAEFGLMALATTVMGFGAHFSRMGIGQALIQKESLDKYTIRAAFTLSLFFNSLVALLLFVSAPWIAQYFKSELLVPILSITSLTFVCNGFSAVSTSLLRRDMQFKKISLINLLSFILAYPVIGIVLALQGWEVWSLVTALLAQSVIFSVLQYIAKPYPIIPTFKTSHYVPILSYGGKVSFNGILTYLMVI
ncbi:MAG: oligosaccharide flippase family protein [Microscillaceae bacterium]|nr:oligosaccharide flippase family protein [Microscillaceae bacterium]